MVDIKEQVIDLARKLVLEDKTNRKSTEIISDCLEKACIKLHVDRKEFIKMFI